MVSLLRGGNLSHFTALVQGAHWGDVVTEALVEATDERRSEAPLMLLSRPKFHPGSGEAQFNQHRCWRCCYCESGEEEEEERWKRKATELGVGPLKIGTISPSSIPTPPPSGIRLRSNSILEALKSTAGNLHICIIQIVLLQEEF